MKLKILSLSVIAIIALSGCSTMNTINLNMVGYGFMPDDKSEIKENINVEKDTFKNITKISTIPYAIIPESNTEQSPIKVLYRLNLNDNNKITLLQLYFIKTHTDLFGFDNNKWGFYDEVVGEDGYNFEFVTIDKEVTLNRNKLAMTSSNVETNETFAINLNLNKLKDISSKNYNIKIYGQKKNFVVKIPEQFSSAIYDYIKENNLK